MKVALWLAVSTGSRLSDVRTEYKAMCSPPKTMTVARFKAAVRKFLSAEDERLFANATGVDVARLMDDAEWDRMSPTTLLKIASGEKVLAHPLNRLGLHPLRALLAERMADSRRVRRGSTAHSHFQSLDTDGIVVIEYTDTDELECDADLLRAVSGYASVGDTRFSERLSEDSRDETDIQLYMHVDTHMPTWKVWLFTPTSMDHGPFHFVKGSHRNTLGKLRWLYERTSHLVVEPPPHGDTHTGPFADTTHGFHASIRFEGFDWAHPAAIAPHLQAYGFPPPTPIVTTAPLTLVIADTSAFHFRGLALPNRTRRSHRLRRRHATSLIALCYAGVDIPRKNAFFCDDLPPQC